MKRFLAVILTLVFVVTFTVPAFAYDYYNDAQNECVFVNLNKGYSENGKFYMDYNFKSEYHDAVFQVSLYNSSGKKVLVWPNEYTLKAGQTANRRYGANYSSFPSGAYTMKVTAIVQKERQGYVTKPTGTWNFKINHKQPAYIKFISSNRFYNNDDSYSTKFVFNYYKYKGKSLHYEIYNANGKRVYQETSGKPLSLDQSQYRFTWNGYPSDGGLQCQSGDYTIKYWAGNSKPKQTKVHLEIE